MKLQIKTLSQKCVVVDIEETKTVYELKKELSLFADIGVKPELQKLIYAGKILENEDTLSSYKIDVKKFLVIMILKQPLQEEPKSTQTKQEDVKAKSATIEENEKDTEKDKEARTSSHSVPEAETKFKTPLNTSDNKKDEMVSYIVGMGYAEADVRKALEASFNNPERAIEYLIEGLPLSSPIRVSDDFSDTDVELSPLEIFRTNPQFQNLRAMLEAHPDLLDQVIENIGETNPELLRLVNENKEEFIRMMIDNSDDLLKDEDFEDDEFEDD